MASNTTSTTVNNIENQYFYEDEVFRIDKRGRIKFGLVMENFEAVSSDAEADFEDVLNKGEIRVAWHPDGKEEILDENSVGLADRTLMPGDVVRRLIPGKDTQRGYCHEIFVKADVKIVGSGFVVKNVAAERLHPLLTMPRDNAVCLDSWVGSTKDVTEKLILKSTCGSVLELRPDLHYCPLKDTELKTRNGFFSGTLFYPGQILVGPVSALDSAKWITTSHEMRTSRKHKTVDRKFIVQSVEIEGVWVHWQCKALSEENELERNPEGGIQQPKCYVTGEDLKKMKRLNLFESCMLQINDKNYLTIEENDAICRKSLWKKEQSNKYKIIHNQLKKDELLVLSNTKTATTKETAQQKIDDSCDICELTTTECDLDNTQTKTVIECDRSKLCPKIVNCSKLVVNSNSETKFTPTTNCLKERNNETVWLHTIKTNDGLNQSNIILLENDEWLTDEDESGSMSDSGSVTTISSCSSTTPKSSPKRSPLLTKKMKRFRKRNPKSHIAEQLPRPGQEVVTEALVVYSTATVVWQDGTIETGIPSTQLYPIHHLDDHEFFPGDFVLAGNESADTSHRDYGVIQKVDHQGRTAQVKWFQTYTCADEPMPRFVGESEVSVYDLKDHPDFQYRPGTIVIRVANFIGNDALCTAGQVIDNYPEGRVKVWWVDGHISMCWPQDLFEVGQYDADNNFWSNGDSDNDSWETESEVSELGGSPQKSISKPHLAHNLERARVAMARLEEMFNMNPNLQNQEVMRKLLGVYKKCRYLDRLMNTNFFHENNFMGLLERVRKGGNATTAERVQDQMNRLFNQTISPKINIYSCSETKINSDILGSLLEKDCTSQITSTPNNGTKNSSIIATTQSESNSQEDNGSLITDSFQLLEEKTQSEINSSMAASKELNFPLSPSTNALLNLSTSSDISSISDNQSAPAHYQNILFSQIIMNIDKATKRSVLEAQSSHMSLSMSCVQPKNESKSLSQNDSGNYSKNGGGTSTYQNSNNSNSSGSNNGFLKIDEDLKSTSCCSIELAEEVPEFVCAKLCTLIKRQLVKALHEINQRYCQPSSLSEVVIEEYEIDEKQLEENINNEVDGATLMDSSIDEVESVTTTPVIAPVPLECFIVLDTAPNTHKYHLTMFHPTNAQQFYKAVRHEHKLLRTALPSGVWVRVFEDRMDLLSVMIEGPKKTPYEDGMFLFDIQLGNDYPRTAPLCHYISYCSDRLNPNLYEDGKVCVSLLGTWSGRGSEVWGANSTLLQVIVSIQGLILVSEPYFNEAGYEKQKGTQQGKENSRMYNEMVVLKLVQSMTKLMCSPPEIFKDQIHRHFKERGKSMYDRIKGWMDLSNKKNDSTKIETTESLASSITHPDFPLVPASRGFCLTLAGLLENFLKKLETIHD